MPSTRRSKTNDEIKGLSISIQVTMDHSKGVKGVRKRRPPKNTKQKENVVIKKEAAKKTECIQTPKLAIYKRKVEETVIPSPKIFDFDESDAETSFENTLSHKSKVKRSKQRGPSTHTTTKKAPKRTAGQKDIISNMNRKKKAQSKTDKRRSPVSDDSGVFMTPPSVDSTLNSGGSATSTPNIIPKKQMSHVPSKERMSGAGRDSRKGNTSLPSPPLDLSPVELATPMLNAQVLSQVSSESQEPKVNFGSPKLAKTFSSPGEPLTSYSRVDTPDQIQKIQVKKKPKSKKWAQESTSKWDILAEMMNSEFDDLDENFELSIE